MAIDRSITKVTRQSILAAIQEYDEIGQASFLAKYGFRPSRLHPLNFNGKKYDSKAIVGAAFGYLENRPSALKYSEFVGGQNTVVTRLEALGFSMSGSSRNAPWSDEELILALHLYFQHDGSPIGPNHPAVIELSDFLNQLAGDEQGSTFRNPNGVAMKLMNFRSLDPKFTSKGGVGLKSIGKGDRRIWEKFGSDAQMLAVTAIEIRSTSNLLASDPATPEPFSDDYESAEGTKKLRSHFVRERDPKLAKKRKEQALSQHGKLACETCEFDFLKTYGPRGLGFIEAHHTNFVHTLEAGDVTKLSDLALLCSNCHRMIHAGRPWLTIEQLRSLLAENAASGI